MPSKYEQMQAYRRAQYARRGRRSKRAQMLAARGGRPSSAERQRSGRMERARRRRARLIAYRRERRARLLARERRKRGGAAVRAGTKRVIPVSPRSWLSRGKAGLRHVGRLGGKAKDLGLLAAGKAGLTYFSKRSGFKPSREMLASMRSRLPAKYRQMPVSQISSQVIKHARAARDKGASRRAIRQFLYSQAVSRLPAEYRPRPAPPPISPHVPPEASPGALAPEVSAARKAMPPWARRRGRGRAVRGRVWPLRDPDYLAFLGAWYPYSRAWEQSPYDMSDLSGDTPFDAWDDADEEASLAMEGG